jgi:hypothetical protein
LYLRLRSGHRAICSAEHYVIQTRGLAESNSPLRTHQLGALFL